MSGRRRFRGKVVYTGGIVSQRAVFREKVDTGNPATVSQAPGGGGGGAGGLAWDYSAPAAVAKDFERVWGTNGQTPKTPSGLDIYLGNAIGAESITYSATGLPSGLSIDSVTGKLTGSANPVGYSNVTVTASDGTSTITKTLYIVQNSQQQYTSAGTYDFIVPDFVNEISAVCIGPGGGGGASSPTVGTKRSGSGGGLRWISNLPVIPGETLTVTIPAQPSKAWVSPSVDYSFTNGTPVTLKRGADTLLEGGAGGRGSGGGGGTPPGTKPYGGLVGGGNGAAGLAPGDPGGGAGGYDGNAVGGATAPALAFQSEGAGAGAPGQTSQQGGGGVGLLGRGRDGVNFPTPGTANYGRGGSGGTNGQFFPANGIGGTHGGGGSNVPFTPSAAPGGRGGIGGARIIWGGNRNYPSNNTGNY